MTKVEILRERALTLTREQSSDSLVEAFLMTDEKLDALRGDRSPEAVDEYLAIVEARGWMMDVLDERGDLGRIMDES